MIGDPMETDKSERNEGTGAAAWVVVIILSVLAAALYGCGCSSSKPTSRYPVPHMLDPVTERTPDVRVN
jgi:hypothetical protein